MSYNNMLLMKTALIALLCAAPLATHASCIVEPELIKYKLIGSKELYTTWKLTVSSNTSFPMTANLKFKVTYLTKPDYVNKKGKESVDVISHRFAPTTKNSLKKGRYDYTINDRLAFDVQEIISVDVHENPDCFDGFNDREINLDN